MCCEARRVETQIGSYNNCYCHRHTCRHQFAFFRDLRVDRTFDKVVRYSRRDRQKQTSSRRKRSSQTTSSNQTDYPTRQVGDFGVGQNQDVAVELGQLVTGPAFFSGHFLHSCGLVVVVLDLAVAVLVFPVQKTSFLPRLHPVVTIFVLDLLNSHSFTIDATIRPHHFRDVQASHCTNSRSSQVQQSDEHQGPTGRPTGVRYFRHGEEAHDYVRQTSSTDHQRQGEQNHVERVGVVSSVLVEAKFGHDCVQFRQQRLARSCVLAEQAQGRDRVASQLQRDEDCRNGVSSDQYAVLSNLRVGNTLHAAENGVGEYNSSTDEQTGCVVHFQEATKRNTNAGHLTDNVGGRGHNQADNSHDTGSLRVEAVTDEFRHGELAELTQVRRKQQCQQHVAAGPAHQERRVVVTGKGDKASHRNERCSRHPVSSRRHTVGDRVNTTPSGVEFRSRARTGPDCDADVKCEARTHKQQVDRKLIHLFLAPLFFVYAVVTVEFVHAHCVVEDQNQEDDDRTLLCEPETKIGSADGDAGKHRAQQNAESK